VSRRRRETKAPPRANTATSAGRTIVLAGALLAVVVAVLYVRTAARDIVFGDAPELSGAAIVLGVAHPPGYPLWTVVGHLFTLLPLGTLPFRLSLFSVAAAVAAVGVTYVFAYRVSRSLWGALAAATALALSPIYWRWSIVPEVFALNDLLAAFLLFLVWTWRESPMRSWRLLAAAFVGGLGMANQQTIALLAPACLYVLWLERDSLRRRPASLVLAALAFLAGLLPYAYLPWAAARDTTWNWSDISSPADLIDHLLRRGYGTGSLIADARFQGGAIVERLTDWGRSFTPVEAALIALGALQAYRTQRAFLVFTFVAAGFAGPLFIVISNANVAEATVRIILERFFILSHVTLAPLAAFGVLFIAERAARVASARATAARVAGAAAVVGAAAIAMFVFADVDESEDHIARTYAEDLLASTRQNAILFISGDPVVFPIAYLQTIEGSRPDVTVVTLPLTRAEWYVRQLRRAHPDLVLTYPSYGTSPATMRALIEPNGRRPLGLKAELLDNSTAELYWVYRHGVMLDLRPFTENVDLQAYADDSGALLARYRPPAPAFAAGRPWVALALQDYALVPYFVGHEFELGKRYADARTWYQRALQIDPTLAAARDALAKLPRQ
jgi:hypothetical protein